MGLADKPSFDVSGEPESVTLSNPLHSVLVDLTSPQPPARESIQSSADLLHLAPAGRRIRFQCRIDEMAVVPSDVGELDISNNACSRLRGTEQLHTCGIPAGVGFEVR